MTAMKASTKPDDLPPMTLDEFLAWDGDGHVGRLELWNGKVRAMAPASATHAIIQLNIGRAIGNHLHARKSPCRVGTEAPIVPHLPTGATRVRQTLRSPAGRHPTAPRSMIPSSSSR